MGARPPLRPQLIPVNNLPAMSISYELAILVKPIRSAAMMANRLLNKRAPFLLDSSPLSDFVQGILSKLSRVPAHSFGQNAGERASDDATDAKDGHGP